MHFIRIKNPKTPGGTLVLAERDFNPALHEKADKQDPIPRDDGPIFEEWVLRGYTPSAYPPQGYTAKDSPGYTAYLAEVEARKHVTTEVAGQVASSTTNPLLDGNVASVQAMVIEHTNVDELTALCAAEEAGKKRKGVLDAIYARLTELDDAANVRANQ